MFNRFRFVAAALLTLALARLPPRPIQQRPFTSLWPATPGGTGDIVARLIAAPLAERVGQTS